MTRTIPYVVSCLFLFGLCSLVPFSLQGAILEMMPSNDIAPSDTLFIQINDCSDEASLCLEELPLSEAIRMSIVVDNAPYQKSLVGCNFDTISAYSYNTLFGGGDLGPYELTEWGVGDTVFTGVFQNIPDLVDSMNLWDPQGNWLLDATSQSISGGFGGNSYSPMSVLVIAINIPSIIGYNFGMEAIGTELRFDAGIHNVTLFDSLNNSFLSGVIVVSCVSKKILRERVLVGETMTKCLDFTPLLTEPKVVAFCDFLSQENIDFEIVNNDSCIIYVGNEVGLDTACIIACDDYDYCDTTILIVEAYDISHYRELYLYLPLDSQITYCLDTTILNSPIVQLINDCPTNSGTNIDFNLEQSSYCTVIDGINIGQDTICLLICNDLGLCDTTILYVNVSKIPTTETIELTLFERDSQEICLETTELAGNITEIESICENNLSETIFFNINNVDLCFKVTTLNIGVDSICTVICDNFLICDTTYYIISVVSSTLSLTATPDQDTTSVNSPTTINILGNDDIPDGIITNLELYTPNGEPIYGIATTNPDGTLRYTPNRDVCGVSDEIGYIICNNAGCDTAEVTIYIDCAEPPSTTMKFYNGFSPNDDGVNDRFTIDGIAQYPNNELIVLNRWGIKVYQMRGYKNAWDGTWNRKRLPDGTYFYILKDGVGREYSGSLEIRR